MISETIISSLHLIIAVIEILLAIFFLLNGQSVLQNRTISSILVLFGLNSLAIGSLSTSFTFKESEPWLWVLVITSYMSGPLIYLASVSLLRPNWFKHRWLYWPITFILLLIPISVILDISNISQSFFSDPIIFLSPDPNKYAGGVIGANELTGGFMRWIATGSLIGFPTITLICPTLVVGLRDRQEAPATSKLAWVLFIATLVGTISQLVLIFVFPVSITTLISNLAFAIGLTYSGLRATNTSLNLRQLQKTFGNWSVSLKLMMTVLTVIIPTVFIISLVTVNVLRNSTLRQVGNSLHSLASTETRAIGNEILDQIGTLEIFIHSTSITAAIEQQNESYLSDEIQNVIEKFPNLLGFTLADKNGTLIAATTTQKNENFSRSVWWQKAYNEGQGDIFIGPIEFNLDNKGYFVEFAIPVFSQNQNEVIGILHSQYSLQSIVERLYQNKIGQTGQSNLFYSSGFQIPDPPNTSPIEGNLDWEKLLQKNAPWQITPYNQMDTVLAWTTIQEQFPEKPLNGVDWRIVVSQSIEEALEPLRIFERIALLTSLVTLGMAVIITMGLGKLITFPLENLTKSAERVRDGDLQVSVEVMGRDEFGKLAESFNSMTSQLRDMVVALEEKVIQRTHDIEKRAVQLQTAAEVVSVAASIRELDELLTQATYLISERFNFYHVGVFLLDENKEFAVLHAANSPGGQRMLARGHKLKLGEVGIVGYVTGKKKPRIALDVGADATYFDNPDLPKTRSEMAVPLISGGEVLGALDVQSVEEAAFSQEDLSILQVLADQLAIAIENANLFASNQAALAEAQTALETARRAYQEASREGWQDLFREKQVPSFIASSKGVESTNQSQFTPEMAEASVKERTIQADATTVAVPIRVQENLTGVIRLRKPEADGWTKKEINLIESITEQLGSALESARLYQDTQTSYARANALFQVSRSAIEFENIPDLLKSVVDSVAQTLPADRVSLVTLDLQSKRIIDYITSSPGVEKISSSVSFEELLGGLNGWVLREQKPALSPKDVPDPRESGDSRKRRKESDSGSMIVVPLIYRENILGTMTAVNAPTERDFTEEDIDLMVAMANQTATALENARLFEIQQRRAIQLQTAAEVSQASSSILDLNELLPQAVELIRERFNLYYAGIFLIDETNDWAVLQAGTGKAGQIQLERNHKLRIGGDSMIGQAIAKSQARIAMNIGEEEKHFQNPVLPETQSEMALPLRTRGQTIGAMTIQSNKSAAFSQGDITTLQTMADQLANTIQNARLFSQNTQLLEETRRRASQLQTAAEIARDTSETLAQEELLKRAVNLVLQRFGYYHASIFLLDDAREFAVVKESTGEAGAEMIKRGHRLAVGSQSIIGNVTYTGQPLVVNNVTKDPIHHLNPLLPETKAELGIPLKIGRRVIGALDVQSTNFDAFSPDDIAVLQTLTDQIAVAIDNARSYELAQNAFQEARDRVQALSTLFDIGQDLSTAPLELKEIGKIVVTKIVESLGPSGSCTIALYEPETDLMRTISELSILEDGNKVIAKDPSAWDFKLSNFPTTKRAMDDFKTLVVKRDDPKGDPAERDYLETIGADILLILPLAAKGEAFGVIEWEGTGIQELEPDQVNFATIIANQAAAALDNARSYQLAQNAFQQARKRLEELTSLYDVSKSLAAAPLLSEEIAEIVIESIIDALGGASNGSLAIWEDPETKMMRTLVDVTYEEGNKILTANPSAWDFNLEEYPATFHVMRTLKPLVVQAEDQDADPNELAYLKKVGADTLLIIPVATKGQAFGVIEVENLDGKREFSPEQINFAMTIANQGAAALENTRLYEEQLSTAEQLRELDKLKNQFLANMSHELRTPLNSIIGFSRVILKGIDGPITELQEQDLTAIYSAGQHLLGLINDILDLSRIEAGKMELSFEELDLATIITSVMSTARGLVKEKPVGLDYFIEPNLPKVWADSTRIRQVLLNLLQNAAKFTEEGLISIHAKKKTGEDGRQEVKVSVTDTGIGIAPEDLEKLFQPFSQVDASPTRKTGGSGLGLSISRNLVELHGGQIEVTSNVGEGSTFFFNLPIAIEDTQTDVEEDRKVVLSIDDDPQVLKLYERYLSSEGYQVISLTDPREAIEQAIQLKPFAITLDVMMPNQDGWQVIQALKDNPDTADIPVIFCTIIENPTRGYSLGAANYLMKPILGEDLVNALSQLNGENDIHQILVIDDDPSDLLLVEKALQLNGTYQVFLAKGGQEGLDFMKARKPDAIILDLMMPDPDGFEVLDKIHSDPSLKDIPVIIYTAADLSLDQQKLLSQYSQKMISKGHFSDENLLACLQQSLKRVQKKTGLLEA